MNISISNSTSHPGHPCPSCNTLFGGSAAFTIIALILGNLAQPPGCLVLPAVLGSYRVWRLSPVMCAIEGITILIELLQIAFSRTSQQERAFMIMAERTTATHDETRNLVEYLERPKLELIVPMMLQIIKVVFIRWSTLTTVLAVIYWLDWAAVQYCHCCAWFRPIMHQHPRCNHMQGQKLKNSLCAIDWLGREQSISKWNRIGSLGGDLVFCSNFLSGMFALVGLMIRFLYGRYPGLNVLHMVFIGVVLGLPFPVIWLRAFTADNAHSNVPNIWAQARYCVMCVGFLAMGCYYALLYVETGTYKPAWLDWLG